MEQTVHKCGIGKIQINALQCHIVTRCVMIVHVNDFIVLVPGIANSRTSS